MEEMKIQQWIEKLKIQQRIEKLKIHKKHNLEVVGTIDDASCRGRYQQSRRETHFPVTQIAEILLSE